MAKPLTKSETAELASVLQALLDRVREGNLEASEGAVQRIKVAIKALQIVLGEAEASELDLSTDEEP